jgi:hypothetical protein
MGATLLYGVRLKREPLTAGSFHIWESPKSHVFRDGVLGVAGGGMVNILVIAHPPFSGQVACRRGGRF